MDNNNNIYSQNGVPERRPESLDLFHEAQQAAMNGDSSSALHKLSEALLIAGGESDPEWIAYIEGTIAYLRGDLETLKSQLERAGANAKILTVLKDGLEHRGRPDYKADYGL